MSLSGSKSSTKESAQTSTTQTQGLSEAAKAQLLGRMAEINGQKYKALDPSSVGQWMNPYQSQAIDAATADIEAGRGVAANEQRAQMLGRGPLGSSDRRGVYEAELNGQYDRTLATTVGGLRASGYNQALGVAQTENTNANQFDAATQSRIDQLLALLAGNDRVGTSNGTSSGKSSGTQFGFKASWNPTTGFGG